MSRTVLLLLCTLGLTACEQTELATPDPGSCEGLEGENRWPWFAAEAPRVAQTGFEIGDTAPDFQLVDQFGEPTCLWQYSGKVVLIDASALWCGPCRLIAEHTRCVADSFEGELVYLTFIGQDNEYQPADFPDNASWADDFDLSEGSQTPVLVDRDQVFAGADWVSGYPSFMLLDTDMSVAAKGIGPEGEATMRARAAEILGEPSRQCGADDQE